MSCCQGDTHRIIGTWLSMIEIMDFPFKIEQGGWFIGQDDTRRADAAHRLLIVQNTGPDGTTGIVRTSGEHADVRRKAGARRVVRTERPDLVRRLDEWGTEGFRHTDPFTDFIAPFLFSDIEEKRSGRIGIIHVQLTCQRIADVVFREQEDGRLTEQVRLMPFHP